MKIIVFGFSKTGIRTMCQALSVLGFSVRTLVVDDISVPLSAVLNIVFYMAPSQVIVAGYAKTGTKSMNQALSFLGYETYDFFEHYWFHGNEWIEILNRGGTTNDFYEMYKDVDAVMDLPAFFFWEEIHKAFPDAKIILTIRDEDQWFKSYARQIAENSQVSLVALYYILAVVGLNPLNAMKYLSHYVAPFYRVVFGAIMTDKHANEMVSRMLYRRHNTYVMQTAPKEKLLVFNVSDGWEPLCQFLGKEMPDTPFPHKNKDAALVIETLTENPIAIENLKNAKRYCCIFMFLLFSILVAIILTYF